MHGVVGLFINIASLVSSECQKFLSALSPPFLNGATHSLVKVGWEAFCASSWFCDSSIILLNILNISISQLEDISLKIFFQYKFNTDNIL